MIKRRACRVFTSVVVIALLSGLASAPAFAASTKYEDTDPAVVYTPPGTAGPFTTNWFNYTLGADSGGSYTYTALPGASVEFDFYGTGIDWRSVKATNCGIAQVWVNNEAPVLVNLYYGSTPALRQELIWSRTGLPEGNHTLHIVNTGTSDPDTGSRNVGIDFFEVYAPSDIVASAGPNGSISPAGTTSVDHGASQTYTITAAPGYHVADVVVDGGSVGAVTTYEFSNVVGPHTISASFAADPPVVSTPASSPWSIVLTALVVLGVAAAVLTRRSAPTS